MTPVLLRRSSLVLSSLDSLLICWLRSDVTKLFEWHVRLGCPTASMIDLSNTVVQRVRVERDFGITDRYCKSQELGLQRGPLRTFTLSISPP